VSRPGPLPLVWFSSLREPSGYADEARSYLLALEDAGYSPVAREIVWTTMDAGSSGRQRDAFERALARRVPTGDHVWAQHVVPNDRHRNQQEPGARTAIRTMFETDRVPKEFKHRLLQADEVWVPTEFNVDTFRYGGIPANRLRVLPETIDFELFEPSAEPWPIEGTRGFTFLTNFDFTDRKGWDILLDAWAAAFDPDDDVTLVLKCLSLHNAGDDAIRARIAEHLGGRATAPLVVLTDVLPVPALPRLYAAADAYVMASRGEGWGRPYMEAMAMGLPTIGSRWSGNLAFMHDDNSWLVDGTVVAVADDAQQHAPYYQGHRWFEPDADALVQALRDVAAGGPAVAARAAGARAELIERFGPEPTAARIAELTYDLLDRKRATTTTAVWRGDFGSGHSLAVVNDGHVDALAAAGHEVELLPVGAATTQSDAPGVAGHWPPSFEAPSAGPFVLYQPWEFGSIPKRWVESIRNVVDEVWVPSNVVRDAFVDSGVSPELVQVVPNGVDLDRFTPNGPAKALPTSHGTVFLFVGGTIARKGVDLLAEAWRRAFGPDDDVCLVVKAFGGASVYRGQTADQALAELVADTTVADVLLLDEDVPFDELPALYRSADVLVQPYRAEGFCLPALEALACGLPLIVTAGGPTDDFVSDDCAWRIPAGRVAVPPEAFAENGLTLARPGYMLAPDVDALVDALRAATDPTARGARAATARVHAERFGWSQAADVAAARLAALDGRTPVRHIDAAAVPERRGFLFVATPDWSDRDSWAPALHAYVEAFSDADDVTLVFPAAPEAVALLEPELARIGRADAPDIALASLGSLDTTSLELSADAVIHGAGAVPTRARRVVSPDPAALRAAVPLLQEAA
jgi:glycosyltransferase involved in cell wall biosynthesis